MHTMIWSQFGYVKNSSWNSSCNQKSDPSAVTDHSPISQHL